MISTAKEIQVGQVFKEDKTGRGVVVTGFGTSQGDESTIQFTGTQGNIRGEQWSGELSAPIFRGRFTGPLTTQTA